MIDVREHGASRDGQEQVSDRRLFMQLLGFATMPESRFSLETFQAVWSTSGLPCVVYQDMNHPQGWAVLSWSEQPSIWVTRVRQTWQRVQTETGALDWRPELSMLGRSYSTGYEADLEWMLLQRPVETALNPKWPWAVWYPLRRHGSFNKLEGREQGAILREHAMIGRAYGETDLAHDIRLACHGLDAHDNDFVIGLIGAELHPLSHVVQSMRKTRQTSEFIAHMGPFFVGYACWQHAG